MMDLTSYRTSLMMALALHILIGIALLSEHHSEHPVLKSEAKNEPGVSQPIEQLKPVINAVSVDNREVMETVNRLKNERLQQQRAEEGRQRALVQQAELARKQRQNEQQQLQKLKREAEQLAILQKKKLLDEQKHLKQLAEQKVQEEKHLAAIKQQVEKQKQAQKLQETQRLAELKNKQKEDLLKKQEATAAANAAQKALAAQKAAAAAQQQATLNAANAARVAGEVDKYKALIIGAISRQWIVPENANKQLSSQFRIRLAPNGAVLDVSLTRSSGDAILDRSAQSAIYKASPLPVPTDATTFNLFRDITLTVRPETSRG